MSRRDLQNYIATAPELSEVRAGYALSLGAQERSGGIIFLCSAVTLAACDSNYDHADESQPSRVIGLSGPSHRTGDVWHVWVARLVSGHSDENIQ